LTPVSIRSRNRNPKGLIREKPGRRWEATTALREFRLHVSIRMSRIGPGNVDAPGERQRRSGSSAAISE
jgi:hypothetical protein